MIKSAIIKWLLTYGLDLVIGALKGIRESNSNEMDQTHLDSSLKYVNQEIEARKKASDVLKGKGM